MSVHRIVREIASDGSVIIRNSRCSYIFRRLAARAVEIQIIGADCGQFGTSIIDEIALALFREQTLDLFLDASAGTIPTADVSIAWARFLELNRKGLKRVTVLASSKAAALWMGIVRHLSNTGDLIRILSERDLYEARKAAIAGT